MHEWYSIEAKAGSKSAKINIHEQIGKSYWSDGGVGARQFVKDLDALHVDEIQLHINSPGGNVFEGNTIYNALRQHPAKIVVTIDGIAASIASVIAMAGDRVIMPENAMMMIHDPFDLVVGNSSAMRKRADALDKIKTSIVSAYMTRATEEQSSIEQMMTDETWLTADEAVQIGLADEVMAGDTGAAQNCAFGMMSQFRHVPAQILAMSGTNQEIEEKEEPAMGLSLEQVKTDYPDIAGALIEEGRKEGAKAEMERIKSVRAQSLPGHEALIESMIDDGATTGEQAAIRVLNAERQLRASAITNLAMDAETVPNVPVTSPPPMEAQAVDDLTTEDGMMAAWNRDRELREEFSGNYEIYKAYERNKHLAKVR